MLLKAVIVAVALNVTPISSGPAKKKPGKPKKRVAKSNLDFPIPP